MKKEFSVLKDRPSISIVLTRDSVAAGDDVDAPHQKKIKTPSFMNPQALCRQIATGYLPNVQGSGHEWKCLLNNEEIAKIVGSKTIPLIREVQYLDENKIHFAYKSSGY